MQKHEGWSREQLIVALKLYCEIPFGRMHSRNPEIIHYAKLIKRTPSALAMKLTNFASLDPVIRSRGRKGLSGASKADRDIWEEMTSDWPRLAKEIAKIESRVKDEPATEYESERDAPSYVGETRSTVVQTRIGQSFFRRAVLSAYEFKCCITGLTIPELLVASHIIPWRDDRTNRLNPRNGLCLSAVHDRAFDLGFIAVSEDLCIQLSTKLHRMKSDPYVNNTFNIYEGRPINPPKKFFPDTRFIKHHRENVFRG
jgi:hypothetical protein